MYQLYHFTLCPFSRLARIMLTEKQQSFQLIEERAWERNAALAAINPAFELPVLLSKDHLTLMPICPIYAICEYLEAAHPVNPFLSEDNIINAEIRRLFSWFNRKFYHEVTKYIFDEKIMTHYLNGSSPRSNFIRAAKTNLNYHLDYMEFLLRSRKWLAGNNISFADLAAAAQISVLDYLEDVHWDKHQLTKEWYAVMKSRPSFRAILSDRIRGFTPPPHYQNLDF